MAKRILLVDDEPTMLKGLKYSLEQDGYEILTAQDGEEALSVFSENDVDLVLLDVMLPKLDGIQVCQRIRETSNVPILMLTAKGEDMDKILGLEYGADDYMTKPFNILEVKARIKTVLRRVSQPVANEEKKIIRENIQDGLPVVSPVTTAQDILKARKVVREVYLDEKIEQYIADIVFATRYPDRYGLSELTDMITFGGSPRASINLAKAARAYAFIKRRGYVKPEDVRAVVHDVLRHRIGLSYEAEASNVSSEQIISKIVNKVEVP